jgi:hypothetical protein
MQTNPVLKKGLIVGIILLFIGMTIIPSAPSDLVHSRKIITVDNEPLMIF